MLAGKTFKIMVKKIENMETVDNSEKIYSIIEDMRQDGGFTAGFLRDLFHGWLSSSFCEDADINTRSNYYSYMLELATLLDCINGVETSAKQR